MNTNSVLCERTFLANKTLNRENSIQNTNYNTLRKFTNKTLNFDNRQEYEVL